MSDDEFTIYCGNLGENVSEEILYELFLQAGPVEDVRIPTKDGRNQNYGFVTYKHKSSVNYAISIFKHVTLFEKPLLLQKRSNKNNNRHRANKSNGGEQFRGGYPSEMIREDLRSSIGGGRKHHRMFEDDMTASLRGGSSSRHVDPSLAPSSRSVKYPDEIPPLSFGSHPDMYSRSTPYSSPWNPYALFASNNFLGPHVDPRSTRYAYSSQTYGSYRSSREERPNSSAIPSDDYRSERIVTARNHSHRHKQHEHHSRSSHHKSHKSHRRRRN